VPHNVPGGSDVVRCGN